MTSARFSIEYYRYLKVWLRSRDLEPPQPWELPVIGFVALDDDEMPVAMAFLRRCEGSYALVDGLVSNPIATPEKRHEALDIVINQLVIAAKELNLSSILAFTLDNNTLLRSERLGFVKIPQTLLALDIRSQS